MINAKNKAWDILSEEFNSQANVHKRDPKQLKKFLENLKVRAKRTLAKKKRGTKRTGGGKNAHHTFNKNVLAVAAIIPDQVESLENSYDDDGMYFKYDIKTCVYTFVYFT